MITKIKYLKNLAVFKDFNWDSEVLDKSGNVLEFKKTNIIYGRNYSGKTTLSRVFRAMETGFLSTKYDNPQCSISFKNISDVTQTDFTRHNKQVRVFNEDFIRENLKFVVNPDDNIEPFAIIGGDNNAIENEINLLEGKLGSNEDEKETKLYKDLKIINESSKQAKRAFETAENKLNNQLYYKAINNPNGIKYNSDKFGDINYNNNKLKAEIKVVNKEGFEPISKEEKVLNEKLLLEQPKQEILKFENISFSFEQFSNSVKELLTKPIAQSNKLENLVKNAILNKWVKEGHELHKEKLDTCAFCNNEISETRWAELEKHYDEESDKLEKDIISLIINIKKEIDKLNSIELPNKEGFYAKYNDKLDILKLEFNNSINEYKKNLELLISQLEKRKNDIINIQVFELPTNAVTKIDLAIENIEKLRLKSNEYTAKLSNEQKKAKENLRLSEIYNFINTIKYDDQVKNIETLKAELKIENNKKDTIEKEIENILNLISQKQNQQNDEGGAVDKVNEFLNSHFGHEFLTLEAIEFEDEITGNKKYRFEVQRDGKKAHHLSEGEISLIAFCYFMAKLNDIDTKGKKPIIWIDDPISSLDSNHIFFIYTLINTQVFGDEEFEQLFISTHNLNFLKYLKRLPGAVAKTKTAHFIIERTNKESSLLLMPFHIKKYVSEFNYLFSQIYKCSLQGNINDENYPSCYNFGNNARKFLELFLFYKYPDETSHTEKMKNFFGSNEIPVILTERINNEYSHLSGTFERGETVIEVPEMNTAAKLIIDALKQDNDQFEALLNSIGVSTPEII